MPSPLILIYQLRDRFNLHNHTGGEGAQIDHGGLAGLGDDDHTQYIKHSLATALSDFLVASGAGAFVKKTLAETLTILGKAAASGLASLDGSLKVVQDPANATATPAASKIPLADANGKLDGWMTLPLRAVVTSQFDKTNDASLANITGLSVSLITGKTYRFRAGLFVNADATGGHQYAVAGTATASAIKYQVNAISNTTNLNVINSRQTALGGAVGQAGATVVWVWLEGVIVCDGTGTLTIQFAQNVATPATTSSVLTQSFLEAQEI